MLDFFVHREDNLVLDNMVSLLMALEQARSMEAVVVPDVDLRGDLHL